MSAPGRAADVGGGDELEAMRRLGRKWAREAAPADELRGVLRAAESAAPGLPPSARSFVLANGGPDLDPTTNAPLRSALTAAFLDGISTSEGED